MATDDIDGPFGQRLGDGPTWWGVASQQLPRVIALEGPSFKSALTRPRTSAAINSAGHDEMFAPGNSQAVVAKAMFTASDGSLSG